jgi:hypothetical protein
MTAAGLGPAADSSDAPHTLAVLVRLGDETRHVVRPPATNSMRTEYMSPPTCGEGAFLFLRAGFMQA